MLALVVAAVMATQDDSAYQQILAEDDAVMQIPVSQSWLQQANLRARLRRVEADYKHFIATHPTHAPAVAAYASFLYDQRRQDEAVKLWERAIEIDPTFARAYNDLATHYGHYGHAADALRYHQKAYELDPSDPIFHFNWATTCILFRPDARQVYGWTDDEIFRHSLDEFRRARDLAPSDYQYATGYAESFILWPKADWNEALDAWQYCLKVAPSELERQRVCSNIARVYVKLGRMDDAQAWLNKVTLSELQSLRIAIGRRLAQ
jgi:tetratricopeptide (TPR) repeat protein